MWMLTQLTSSLLGDSFSGFGYSPLTHLLISIMGAYLWTTQLLSMVKHFSLAFCQSSLLILWSFQTLTFISANQGVYWSLVGSPPMWCSLCGFTISSVQFSHSVVSDSLPPHESQHARPLHHQLWEFTQTHVHWVSDAIQPSHPLSSPSPPAPNPSHHQGLFQWVNSLHEVAKVLEFRL